MNDKYCVHIYSTLSGADETFYISPTKVEKVIKLIMRPEVLPVHQESFDTLTDFL